MLTMILQMSGATAIYIAATALLWHFWHKTSNHTTLQKLAIGLFFGLCSVTANHFGIDYIDMVLNVRDIGPLAAGLFFDPLSGILSGLIGGIERYIAGRFFYIGTFTRVACSLSTCLAGVLAAILHKWVYEGKRPSIIHCLFLGAEMEVFHMYAIFISNRDNMSMASYVVKICALPMILFTGFGLMACSIVILLLSGSHLRIHLKTPRRNTPIDVRFQRWLMIVVFVLFVFSLGLNYSLHTQSAYENVCDDLEFQVYQYQFTYQENRDLTWLKKVLDDNNMNSDSIYLLVDAEEQKLLTCTGPEDESIPANPEELSLITEHADREEFSASLRQYLGWECLCVSKKLDDRYYLLIGTPTNTIYTSRETQMLETLFLLILVFTALYLLTTVLVERLVVRNLEKVNDSLARIIDGHLNETVTVEESSEFTKLSGDINATVTALRGYIDAAENRIEEELKLAAAIQDAALPKNFNLPYESIELYALMTPARQVGGDFYDFFFIRPEQIVLVIADVSGKGVPASLFMMRAKTAIKNYARSGLGPAKLLERVNHALCEGNDTDMFVTIWLGILDLKTGLMRCANAGHEYPVLMRAGGDYELLKDRHGTVLAVFEDIPMKEYELQLNSGDRLFVYTDGVPEAISKEKEQYGTARMTERLNSLKDSSQQKLLTGMLEDIRRFAGDEEQFDDITMLGVTYTHPEKNRPESE